MPGLRSLVARRRLSAGAPPNSENPPLPSPLPSTPQSSVIPHSTATDSHTVVPRYNQSSQPREIYGQMHHGNNFNLGEGRSGAHSYLQEQNSYSYTQQWDNGNSEAQRSRTSQSYLHQADSTQSTVQQPDSVQDNKDYNVYHPFDSDIPPWPQYDRRRADTPHPFIIQENGPKGNIDRSSLQFSLQQKANSNQPYQQASLPLSHKAKPQIESSSPQLRGRNTDPDSSQMLGSHQHSHQNSFNSYETPYHQKERLSQDKEMTSETIQNSPYQQQCSPQSSSVVYPSQSSQPFIDSPQSSVHSGSPQNFSNTPKSMDSPQYISQYGSPNNPPHKSPQYGSPQSLCQAVKTSGSPQTLVKHEQLYGSPENPSHFSPESGSPKNISSSSIQLRSPKNTSLSSAQSLHLSPTSAGNAHTGTLSPDSRLLSPNNLNYPKSENNFVTPVSDSKSKSPNYPKSSPSTDYMRTTKPNMFKMAVPSPENYICDSQKSDSSQRIMLPPPAHHEKKSLMTMPPPESPPRPIKRTDVFHCPQSLNMSPPERSPTPPPSMNDISALGSPNHKVDTSNLRTGLISPTKSEMRKDTPKENYACKNLNLESDAFSQNLGDGLQKKLSPIEKFDINRPIHAKNHKNDEIEEGSLSDETLNQSPGTKDAFKSPTNEYPEFKRPFTPSFTSPGTSENSKIDIESSLARRGITITRKAVPSVINQRLDMHNNKIISPLGQNYPKSPTRMVSSGQRQPFPKSPWSQAFVDWNPRQLTPPRGVSNPRGPRAQQAYSPRGRYTPRGGPFPLRAEPPCVSMTSVSSGRPITSTSLSKMVSERPSHSTLSKNDSAKNLQKKICDSENDEQNTATRSQHLVNQGEFKSLNDKNVFQTSPASHTVTQTSNITSTHNSPSTKFSHTPTHTNIIEAQNNLTCNLSSAIEEKSNSNGQRRNNKIISPPLSRQVNEISNNKMLLQHSESSSRRIGANIGNFDKNLCTTNSSGGKNFETSFQPNNSEVNKYENYDYQYASKSAILNASYEDDPVKKLSAMLPPNSSDAPRSRSAMLPPNLSDVPRSRCDTPYPKKEERFGDFDTTTTAPYINSGPQIPSNYRKSNQYTYSTLLQNLQAERNANSSSFGQVINPIGRNSAISQYSNHSSLQPEGNSGALPYGSSPGPYASNSSSKNQLSYSTNLQMSEIGRNFQQYYPPTGSQKFDQRSLRDEYLYSRGQEEFISSNIRRDLYPYSTMSETMNTSSIPQYNYPSMPSQDVITSSQYNDLAQKIPSRLPQGYIPVSRPPTPGLPMNFSDQDIPQQSSNYQYYNKTDSRENISTNLSQGYTYGLIPEDVNRTNIQSDYSRRMFTPNPSPAPELEYGHRSTDPLRDYSNQDLSQLSMQMNYDPTSSPEGSRAPPISEINPSIEQQPTIPLDYDNRSLNQVQEIAQNYSNQIMSPSSLQNISQEYELKAHRISNDTGQNPNYINSNTNFNQEYSGPVLTPSGEFPDISQEYSNQVENCVGIDMKQDQITRRLPDVLQEFGPSDPVSEDSDILKISNQSLQGTSNISMSREKSYPSISSNDDINSVNKSYDIDQSENVSNIPKDKDINYEGKSNTSDSIQNISDQEPSQGRTPQYFDQENQTKCNIEETEHYQQNDFVPVGEELEKIETLTNKDIYVDSSDENLKHTDPQDKSNSMVGHSEIGSPSSSLGSPASGPSPNSQERIVIKMKRSDVRIKEESGVTEPVADSSKGNPKPLWTIDSIISKREEDEYENGEYSFSENGAIMQGSNNNVYENKMSGNGNDSKSETLDSNKNHMKSLLEETINNINTSIKNEPDSSDSCLDNNSSGVDPCMDKLSSPTPSLESCSSVGSIYTPGAAGSKRRHNSGHGDSSYASAESNDESPTSVKNCKIVIQRNHRSDSYSCYSLSKSQKGTITERDRNISESEQTFDTKCKDDKIKRKPFDNDEIHEFNIDNIKKEIFKEPDVYTEQDSLTPKESSVMDRRRRYSQRENRLSESDVRPKRKAAVEANEKINNKLYTFDTHELVKVKVPWNGVISKKAMMSPINKSNIKPLPKCSVIICDVFMNQRISNMKCPGCSKNYDSSDYIGMNIGQKTISFVCSSCSWMIVKRTRSQEVAVDAPR